MGIFKRMKRIAKADVNGWLDNLEDPIAMLNEYSREMEEEISKAQKALARQVFVENKQTSLILETKAVIEKRNRQAKLAVEQGEEAIAKLALQEKITQEKQLALFEQQLETIKAQTKLLQEKLNELQHIYNDLQHKKVLLASRANVAQSIKQMQQSTGAFQTEDILRGVSRAEDRILMMEAEVQVGNQFARPLVNDLYLINEEEVDRELEKLKSANQAQV